MIEAGKGLNVVSPIDKCYAFTDCNDQLLSIGLIVESSRGFSLPMWTNSFEYYIHPHQFNKLYTTSCVWYNNCKIYGSNKKKKKSTQLCGNFLMLLYEDIFSVTTTYGFDNDNWNIDIAWRINWKSYLMRILPTFMKYVTVCVRVARGDKKFWLMS